MKKAEQSRVVLVMCGTLREARRIARRVISKRLAACVNIILGPAESFYTWKGRLEKAREYLLVMKTTTKRLAELERELHRLHSYAVPEFIVLPIIERSEKYLSWLHDSVTEARTNSRADSKSS